MFSAGGRPYSPDPPARLVRSPAISALRPSARICLILLANGQKYVAPARAAGALTHVDHRTARYRYDPPGGTHNRAGWHAAKNNVLEANSGSGAHAAFVAPSLRVRESPKQLRARLESRPMGQAPYMLQTHEKNSLRLDWRHLNHKSSKKVSPR